MTQDEFQTLHVGDQVLVHDLGSNYQLRQGVVVSQGRFEAGRLGVHIGSENLQTGAIVYPPWERVHRFPLDPSEPCQFCETYKA